MNPRSSFVVAIILSCYQFITCAYAQANIAVLPVLNQTRIEVCGVKGINSYQNPAALQSATQRVWAGDDTNAAMKAAGYVGRQFVNISLSGDFDRNYVEDVLRKNYCPILSNVSFSDVGYHQADKRLVIILAVPYQINMNADFANEVLALTNAARSKPRVCGDKSFEATTPLKLDTTLNQVASGYAIHQAQNNFMGHTGRDGSQPAERATKGGYVWQVVGENVAAGQTSPNEVVNSWLNSPPHCANLMSPPYTEMGIGYAVEMKSDMKIYWTQLFGKPRR